MQKSNKYDQYDERLIRAIENGADTMDALARNPDLTKLAQPLRVADRWGHLTPEFRIVDKRLQALRKSGRISFVNRRWAVSAS